VRGTENKIKIELQKNLKKTLKKAYRNTLEKCSGVNISPEHFKKVFRYVYYQTGKLNETVPIKKTNRNTLRSVPVQFRNSLSLFLSTTPEHFPL
jgi:hypothetical protein